MLNGVQSLCASVCPAVSISDQMSVIRKKTETTVVDLIGDDLLSWVMPVRDSTPKRAKPIDTALCFVLGVVLAYAAPHDDCKGEERNEERMLLF